MHIEGDYSLFAHLETGLPRLARASHPDHAKRPRRGRNGLLVHGPDHWAVALRSRDGRIQVESGRKPRVAGAASQLPGLRGLARLGEAFALLPVIKRRVPEVQLPFEDAKVIAAMAGSSMLSAGVPARGQAQRR